MGSILSGVGDLYGAFYGDAAAQGKAQAFQEDMMDEQFANLQNMFPFTNQIQDYAMDLYGSSNLGKITDFLENPTPPSVQLQNLSDFFGGFQPQKGYYRTGGGKKGGPGALQNRLYGRFGAGGSGEFAGLGQQMLEKEVGLLESLIPYGQDLAATGFRTDVQPAVDWAQWLFENPMMGAATERFGGSISGSGFQNALTEGATGLAKELGALQVGLDESAAARRLQGLQSGTVQGLFGGPLNRTIDFLGAGAQAGEQYKNAMNQARPGFGLLNALPTFANISTQGGFIQPGFPTSGTDTGNLLSSLGQTLPAAADQLGKLPWDKWFGPDQNQNPYGFEPRGSQTGIGWDMGSMGGTDLGGQTPWLDSGGGGGAPTDISSHWTMW